MSNPKIVVTGANGGLGSAIVTELLKLAPPEKIAVSVRDTDAAERFMAEGVRVRRGDFDDPASLDIAFEGAERVLVISTRSFDNTARFVQQRTAIDAARRIGARHVYYTSVTQRPGSVFDLAAGHHQTEEYLHQCGATVTVFRNGHYIENLPMFLGASLSSGVLSLPEDGPVAWVARQDLAEGIARVMLSEAQVSKAFAFTGPEALDFADIADIAGEIVGRRIERRVIDPEAYVNALVSRGVPARAASSLVSGFESRADGELATVDSALSKILARPLRSIRDVLPSLLPARAAA